MRRRGVTIANTFFLSRSARAKPASTAQSVLVCAYRRYVVTVCSRFSAMHTVSPRTSTSGGPTPRSVSDEGDTPARKVLGPQIDGHLRLLSTIDCGDATVMCCQYHRNGTILAIGLSDGLVKIYDPDTMTLLFTLSDPETQTKHLSATSLRFIPTSVETANTRNLLLVTYASGLVKIWHFSSQSSVFAVSEERSTLCSAFNPEGNKFITGGADSLIEIYDLETRKRLRSCERSDARDKMNGHRWRIFALKYHDVRPHNFISGGWDDTVQFWDDRQKHAIRRFFGPHICGDGLDIDTVHDHILTGSWTKNHQLQVWDFASGNLITHVPTDPTNSSLLYCAQWHGKDYMLCGGCERNTAKVVDRGSLNTVGQITNLEHGVYCLDNTKNGSNPKFAVGAGSSVYIMQLAKM